MKEHERAGAILISAMTQSRISNPGRKIMLIFNILALGEKTKLPQTKLLVSRVHLKGIRGTMHRTTMPKQIQAHCNWSVRRHIESIITVE